MSDIKFGLLVAGVCSLADIESEMGWQFRYMPQWVTPVNRSSG